jgi:16S rRNA (cytosine1402-N4)-methyltransferase
LEFNDNALSDVQHKPVLLHEVLAALDPRPGDFMIDGTVDGGGHATAILQKIVPGGTLLGVDWDETMIRKRIEERKDPEHERYVRGNYADLPGILAQEQWQGADGLLLDLGFSSEQLAQSGRGFSFGEAARHEPLLMTYDPERRSVAEIIREESEESIATIIYEYGGERRSRAIAKAIKDAGRKKHIVTSGELADVIRNALPKHYEHGRIDPATRTFQAFRIYANGELENLAQALDHISEVLKPGGRVVIISFHSLEDRVVKQKLQQFVREGKMKLLTKKPIVASREEIAENPRSRSAKLRAAILIP